MAKEDIDWDTLDKRKFFGYGAAMFSGATTLLYPLHVIKTRQMALPDISPGFKGTWQTVSGMWTSDGVRGFYRGYATSVFGFLPARMVYLASLEVSKSTVSKLGQQLELSDTVLAGVSNFAGGASASLAVQSIGVPLDVISQRQMVYNGAPAAPSAASSAAAASGGAGATPAAKVATVVSSAGAPPAAGTTASAASGGTATTRPIAAATVSVSPSASSAGTGSAAAPPAAASTTAVSSGKASVATAQQPVSASPASGTSVGSTSPKPDATRSFSTAASSASSTSSAKPSAASASRHLSGLQIARTILATEGVRGLYRGFGMSIATVVPSSAVWWAAYGAYQKVIWHAMVELGVRGASAPDSVVPVLDKNTMLVQSGASVAAGLTAGLLTNPLDLIKTRIQVAGQLDGASPTFRSVVGRIIREDGWSGLWRGVLPRMANSAIWGTAMVGIYETLKR